MEKITISEYQSDWGKLFIAESEKIKSTLKCSKVYIDHVGSTAVAGLAAKPIIDILISLNNWDDIDEVVEKLTQLGYRVEDNCPEVPRFFLTKYYSTSFHIHVCQPQSRWARDMKIFKDELLLDKKLCKDYASLKKFLLRNIVKINTSI